MSARELEWWKAYYELEPTLDQRMDWLVASIVQMSYNLVAKKPKPIKDFVLKFEESDEKSQKRDWQHQKALMMMVVATHNAFVDSGQKEAE